MVPTHRACPSPARDPFLAGKVCRVDTASAVSRHWLTGMGVPAGAQNAIVADVEERLADLPSLLRWGSTGADRVLAVMPQTVRRAALRLPGCSEWVRLVTSLTAVAYFERAGSGTLPAQRTPAEQVELSA